MSREHAVKIYAEVGELATTVGRYLAAGFEAGEPALVVATPEHARLFAERLAESAWDADTLAQHGLLELADANATLAEIMQGETPSPSAFEQVVGGLLAEIAARFPGQNVRVYGEMVDLLCDQGRLDSAFALEELWNRLARKQRFTLLCAYGLDLFEHASQVGVLPDVCRLHSHVLPAPDPARLARAVDRALEDVLGPSDAGKVYVFIGDQAREGRVPTAQLALMWVSANLPALAERILASARSHYVEAPLASAAG